ncbi:membrane protein insertion efficiency factor YidD [Candidatus Beckwithbacteria bacterium CG22_combo_CG10-13_8_21_14_all_01_47_9]|uniref:Putative membrane protein insertion efficiency factor n=5 Tax=Candidatus Beckwithiibacteriota TaxID=1752726 RepID=A0A2H0E0S8_9BACT|nr:MAG: membrane protein insertion efficiency factor YidD [Candidatus Beckwithbacteria bacterium CG1_02_47_37]PIP52025.1 MAG: membrane protein insertion efficiency factor YidD [Candidatus Beckwithbacteria bacterium CG23_combo_of_CG06-09_8_20_14_all_47_9]PIP88033.1 MAG: membrane protein insertion efficiency factor YidD [Candidatus Beckwithbacteria bacterium CG22_combo_CG10-13_8_21_14_all_01_47_9]PJA21382.1 MAG: membrane protein insertion efficiency factor YidD [Candidatus Beckwithbacteria bacteri
MKQLFLGLIRFYQKQPRVNSCRFSPTCSEYGYQAIAKYGIFKGSLLGIKRIFKCQPWSKGGLDNVE